MKNSLWAAPVLGILSFADVSRATIGFICSVQYETAVELVTIKYTSHRFCGGTTLKTYSYCVNASTGSCAANPTNRYTLDELAMLTQMAQRAAYDGRLVDFSVHTDCVSASDCGYGVTFYAHR